MFSVQVLFSVQVSVSSTPDFTIDLSEYLVYLTLTALVYKYRYSLLIAATTLFLKIKDRPSNRRLEWTGRNGTTFYEYKKGSHKIIRTSLPADHELIIPETIFASVSLYDDTSAESLTLGCNSLSECTWDIVFEYYNTSTVGKRLHIVFNDEELTELTIDNISEILNTKVSRTKVQTSSPDPIFESITLYDNFGIAGTLQEMSGYTWKEIFEGCGFEVEKLSGVLDLSLTFKDKTIEDLLITDINAILDIRCDNIQELQRLASPALETATQTQLFESITLYDNEDRRARVIIQEMPGYTWKEIFEKYQLEDLSNYKLSLVFQDRSIENLMIHNINAILDIKCENIQETVSRLTTKEQSQGTRCIESNLETPIQT